jgi:stearoyl-CoA desaturase (delta-9 desaturase)
VPYFFSWTGVFLAIFGIYVFGTLGINLAYHRILTHQGLVLPKWLERTFVLLGVCCLEDSPARWVSIHRVHHLHSDEQPDPHSPLVTLFWAHVGWLFLKNNATDSWDNYHKFARDILRDRFYLFLERNAMWAWVNLAQNVLYFSVGLAIGWLMTGNYWGGLKFGASVWLWGVIVRTILVWHITWSVNSITHIWGYRNYETKDNSRNNVLVGIVGMGEGWHNNHHADQRSAMHGHRWFEFDATWWTVRALEMVGLAKDVVRPRKS